MPTLNRPELAKVAVDSVLGQDCQYPCEIIVSNNGANPKTREIFTSGIYGRKVIYLETGEVLPMPIHWERATSFASGEYLMVLPDRRFLKPGAVRQLISSMDNNVDCEAACCAWDEISESGRTVTTKSFLSDAKFPTKEILQKFEDGAAGWHHLPRGLNCILRNDFVKRYRDMHGKYFDTISPDFRSAFNFLFTANNVFVIAESLMGATGFKLSNGIAVLRGDPAYFDTLGRSGEFNFMPKCFQGRMSASIYEDYLRSKFFFKNDGDYRKIMSKPAMRQMMTEETLRLVAARFSKASRLNYLEVRNVVMECGWKIRDDFHGLKDLMFALRQLLPARIKAIYHLAYAFMHAKAK